MYLNIFYRNGSMTRTLYTTMSEITTVLTGLDMSTVLSVIIQSR